MNVEYYTPRPGVHLRVQLTEEDQAELIGFLNGAAGPLTRDSSGHWIGVSTTNFPGLDAHDGDWIYCAPNGYIGHPFSGMTDDYLQEVVGPDAEYVTT